MYMRTTINDKKYMYIGGIVFHVMIYVITMTM